MIIMGYYDTDTGQYVSGGDQPRTFNESSGTWSNSYNSNTSSGSSSGGSSVSNSGGNAVSNEAGASGSNLTNTTSSSDISTGDVEKQYNYIELNTLEGKLMYIPDNDTVKIKAGDTIKLLGLGKYLNGDYYVKDVTRTIEAGGGYSQYATVIRTDFGDKIKMDDNITEQPAVEESYVYSSTPVNQRTYVTKPDDSLYKIAEEIYGDGSQWTKIQEANSDKVSAPYYIDDMVYVDVPIGITLVIP